MKNVDQWVPTKYEWHGKKLRGSRNSKHLGISSRLMVDIGANLYQTYVPKYVKGKLIDLGCGNVPFYELYKSFANEIVCADWPNTFHKNNYLDVECDLNKQLPFANDEFDTIIISEVLEHISNPELTWAEMSRIIKPKGKIILSVPFLYKIHEAPYDFYRYTEFALKNFAIKNNLDVLELKSFGGLPEVLTDIFAKKALSIPFVGKWISAFSQNFCFYFVSTRWGSKISSNTAVAYPLGYFMVLEKR